MADSPLADKVALITGGAHRIGASIARRLHAEGMNIAIHYRNSQEGARALQEELQAERSAGRTGKQRVHVLSHAGGRSRGT